MRITEPVLVEVEWHIRLADRYSPSVWPWWPEDPDRRVPEPPEDPVTLGWLSALLAHGARAAAYQVPTHTSDGTARQVLADVLVDPDSRRAGVTVTWASEDIIDADAVEGAIRPVLDRMPEMHEIALAATGLTLAPGDRGTLLRGWETLVALNVSSGTILRGPDPLAVLRQIGAAVPYRWLPRLALAGLTLDATTALCAQHDEAA